jgi:hypothetical protein
MTKIVNQPSIQAVVRCQVRTLQGVQCKRQALYRERGTPALICGIHANGRYVVLIENNKEKQTHEPR